MTGIVPYVLIGSGDSWDVHVSAVNVTGPASISLKMSRPQAFIVFVVAVFVVNCASSFIPAPVVALHEDQLLTICIVMIGCITLAVIMLTVWVILLRISDTKNSESKVATKGIASAPADSTASVNDDEPEAATQEWRSVPLEVLSSLPLTGA